MDDIKVCVKCGCWQGQTKDRISDTDACHRCGLMYAAADAYLARKSEEESEKRSESINRCPKCGADRKSDNTECLVCLKKKNTLAEMSVRQERMRKAVEKVYSVLIVLAVVNFFAFMIITLLIGGSGVTGKIENGRYYVGSHGIYTEVSQTVYTFTVIHSCSHFPMFTLAFAAAGIRALIKKSEQVK